MFPFLPTLHSLHKYNIYSTPCTYIIQTNKTVFLPTYIHNVIPVFTSSETLNAAFVYQLR
ncbi:hypothetical protein GBAR_LOCUS13774, partial [Geodia barretti]